MKALSIIGIVFGSLMLLLGIIWMITGKTEMEMGLGFWNFVTAGYLLAFSIVCSVKTNKK